MVKKEACMEVFGPEDTIIQLVKEKRFCIVATHQTK